MITLKDATGLGLLIVAVASAAITFSEYEDHKENLVIERSLDYADRLATNERLTQIQDDSLNLLFSLEKDIKSRVERSRSEKRRSEIYSRIIVNAVYKQGFNVNLIRLLGFYEDVAICVKQGLCSYETALALLGGEISAAYYSWVPFVATHCERSGNPAYLYDLSRFVDLYQVKKASKRSRELKDWQASPSDSANRFCKK